MLKNHLKQAGTKNTLKNVPKMFRLNHEVQIGYQENWENRNAQLLSNLDILGTFFNVFFHAWLFEMVFEHLGA